MNPLHFLNRPGTASRRWVVFSLLALTFCACAWPLRAAEPGAAGFAEGNRQYADGQYTRAVSAYEGAVRHGDYSANLFFNLGNAYFRSGDRGRAILNYERALLLEPGHDEAAANLSFVRGRRPVVGAEDERGAGDAALSALAAVGTDRYSWLAAGGGWLALIAFAAALLRPSRRTIAAAIGIVGVVVFATSTGMLLWLDGGLKSSRRALVLIDGAPVLYAPADNARPIVRLPVGGEVRVLSAEGAWSYVRFDGGKRGWISSDKVARIDPAAG